MKEAARQARNEERLAECYPVFARRVRKVIVSLEGDGWRPRIQDAYRSPADQRKAYEAGNSKLLFGYHNVTGANGKPESLAVDLLDDNRPIDPTKAYLIALAHFSRSHGLNTGIGWGLPQTIQAGLDRAIAGKETAYTGRLGWDCNHVEPTDVTVALAKKGLRPI